MVMTLGLAACGGGSDAGGPSTTAGPGGAPSAADIDRLSLFLVRDRQAGGAEVRVRFASGGEQVVLSGQIDWVAHEGAIEVASTAADGSESTPYEVRFTADRVFEAIPEEARAELAAAGRPGIEWSGRAPNAAEDPLDRILALLVSFAAEQPDNPALLAQRGVTVERHEEVDGDAATVYRTKAEALYWILDESGVLARFQGSIPGLDEPVTIDLTGHGPVRVEMPQDATVIDAAELDGA